MIKITWHCAALPFFLATLSIVGCATNRDAQRAAIPNATNIRSVRLGQTMTQVLAEMHGEPEVRKVRAAADGVHEEWSWVTEYETDALTTVEFLDRKVVEIRTGEWDGSWSTDTIRPDENLEAEEDITWMVRSTKDVGENGTHADVVVRKGMRIEQVEALLGPPLVDRRVLAAHGRELERRFTYPAAGGKGEVVVVFKNDVVVSIEE